MPTTTIPSGSMIVYAVILFLVEFVRGAFLVSFLPVYGVQQLGLAAAGIGLAVSLHYVTDTLIKCTAGYLLDRFSLRLVAPIGLAASLAGLLLVQQAHSLWALALAAGLFGVGMSPVWLGGLSRADAKRRASHMGIVYSCWLAGLGAGPVVLNLLLDRSYFASYWLMIGLWGAALILSLFIGGEQERGREAVIPLGAQLVMLWERVRSMRVLLPAMILQTTAAGMLVPVLPSFAQSSLGLAYSEYSLVLIAAGALTVAGLVPMGRLSDRSDRRWFVIIGFASFAACLFTLTQVSGLWASIAVAGVLGISYAAVLPSWNAVLAQFVPSDQKGLGWGLFSSVEGVGVMIGPVLGGWLADRYQVHTAVWSSAALLGTVAVYYAFISSGPLLRRTEA
ncbi:Predicted arabinose efflux permease, MFS family [Paenibacillus sp. UNCCL117]|uniref:MFS transporter n=1 Tax=unclassified Paenibacillus TaxID=185978 RepID=UPI00088573A0|nr:MULTISPECIES: MFS transporter [unclassified Paenibacillus]SDE14510.1 Predicted arabinose efflux permease, MFS family [Paenibacillus sp. cl123]SFW60620.1 Predicted arabinose efflux permease, MFS family [Paenibacillus sp. UNCCL117]